MAVFDMVVVGSGGGPDECNLSGYLIKPKETTWDEGIIALEAGSGQGALSRILRDEPELFEAEHDIDEPVSKKLSAAAIYSYVQCFLISHAHLDHICSLVLSAGSLKGKRKRIYAASSTLKDLESVFANRLWPNLASWNEVDDDYRYLYCKLDPSTNAKYKRVFPQCSGTPPPPAYSVSVRSMALSHGCNESGQYDSHAFFVRHDRSAQEFLFFGDVEPDIIAKKPMLSHVWRACAPKIASGILSALFIECSWPEGRRDDELFGHFTPSHLVDELCHLAVEVVECMRPPRPPLRKKRKTMPTTATASGGENVGVQGALAGLRVYITHCKDDMDAALCATREMIVGQIRTLVAARGLGAEVLGVAQGTRIEI